MFDVRYIESLKNIDELRDELKCILIKTIKARTQVHDYHSSDHAVIFIMTMA